MDALSENVSADPEVMHGKPVIEGTGVPVEVVLNTLAEGVSIEEICKEYDLSEEQILSAVNFAADKVSKEEYRALEA
jgi:uncharacterized protein (DUF433 family)